LVGWFVILAHSLTSSIFHCLLLLLPPLLLLLQASARWNVLESVHWSAQVKLASTCNPRGVLHTNLAVC
jgi:hypothetical protein